MGLVYEAPEQAGRCRRNNALGRGKGMGLLPNVTEILVRRVISSTAGGWEGESLN